MYGMTTYITYLYVRITAYAVANNFSLRSRTNMHYTILSFI